MHDFILFLLHLLRTSLGMILLVISLVANVVASALIKEGKE